ncbi:MAG: hypothetical protein U0P45_07235 [Acidimicrobiales bacterium]
MPTRAGWTLVAASAGSLAAARLLGLLELYVLGAAGLLLVGAAVALARRPCDLDVRRELHPRQVSAGSVARMDLQVSCPRRRSPVVTLADPVAGTVGARLAIGPLAPGEATTVGYRLPTRRRGHLAVGPLDAEVTDPFGLARRRHRGGRRAGHGPARDRPRRALADHHRARRAARRRRRPTGGHLGRGRRGHAPPLRRG